MSIANKEIKKVAVKNIKDDVNNVLKNAANQTEKSNKIKKSEISDTKKMIVSFYDKILEESTKDQKNELKNENEQEENNCENIKNNETMKNKETVKNSQTKSGKKRSELVIPCTNDLCAKVRQLVEMNAQVQRFRKKFLEPPIPDERKLMHQRKIEAGNEYSRKNLKSFRKTKVKPNLVNKSLNKNSFQTPSSSKKINWDSQTHITSEVLNSSSCDSLKTVKSECEESMYIPCKEYSSKEESFDSISSRMKKLKKFSWEMGFETDYATCVEDNQGNENLIHRTSSARMLSHFKQLLCQHSLNKDKENGQKCILNSEEVSFLEHLVEADERYHYLKSEDHKLLKDILKSQLKQIEIQEKILEQALKKLRQKTGSLEDITHKNIKSSNQLLKKSSNLIQIKNEAKQSLSSWRVDVSSKIENLTTQGKFIDSVMEQIKGSARNRRKSKEIIHENIAEYHIPNNTELSHSSSLVESVENEPINVSQILEFPNINSTEISSNQFSFHILEDKSDQSSPLILGDFECKSSTAPPVLPTESYMSSDILNCEEKLDNFYNNENIKEKNSTSETENLVSVKTMPTKLSTKSLQTVNLIDDYSIQTLVPPLNLEEVASESGSESDKDKKMAQTYAGERINSEDSCSRIQVIFKNISSPQKEIELLKAISCRLEKSLEKSGLTDTWVKSIEVNLNDDSENAALAVKSSISFSEIKIDSEPLKDQNESTTDNVSTSILVNQDNQFEEVIPKDIQDSSQNNNLIKKPSLYPVSYEYFSFIEEYATSHVNKIYKLTMENIVKEFKMKYLSLDELKDAGDFYIFRSKTNEIDLQKTNFEDLQSRPLELVQLLTCKSEKSDHLSLSENDVQEFQYPNEAIIKSAMWCFFKTIGNHSEQNNYGLPSPQSFGIGKTEVNSFINQNSGAGDEICCPQKLLSDKIIKIDNTTENLKELTPSSSSPLTSIEEFNKNLENHSNIQSSTIPANFDSTEKGYIKKFNICEMQPIKRKILKKKRKIKNFIVFVAQFVLFALLVVSLSMPDYQCLTF